MPFLLLNFWLIYYLLIGDFSFCFLQISPPWFWRRTMKITQLWRASEWWCTARSSALLLQPLPGMLAVIPVPSRPVESSRSQIVTALFVRALLWFARKKNLVLSLSSCQFLLGFFSASFSNQITAEIVLRESTGWRHYWSTFRSKDDTSDSVEGPRFSVHDNGTLEIYSAEKDDTGPYTCFAKNTEGSSAINVMLSVKGKGFFRWL